MAVADENRTQQQRQIRPDKTAAADDNRSKERDSRSGQRIGIGRRVDGLYHLDQLHIPSSTIVGRHPTVKWAQRSDETYLTVELPDAKDVKLNLEPEGKFHLFATRDNIPYEVDIELFDKINVKESKFNTGVRNIVCIVTKAEKKWWSRLLKEEGKPPAFIKVDWDKWIDEDDENENATLDNVVADLSKKKKIKQRKRSLRKKNPLQQIIKKLKLNCIGKM